MRAIDTNGLDEEIRCEMCKNPMHTDRGCDGHCKYDEILYEKIIQILNKRITPLPSVQPNCIECLRKIDDYGEEHYVGYNDKMFWDIRSILENPKHSEANHYGESTEIVRCKDCKHWRQQTNYQGAPLSFGFCESDDMWRSLYGETTEVEHIDTDDNHYCGYAERRTDEFGDS